MDMDTAPVPDEEASTCTEPTGKPRTRRTLDERIAAAAQRAAVLRQQRAAQQRKHAERLVAVLGSTLRTMMEEDASLRTTITTQILARVMRPSDRELLQSWLASFPK